MQQSAIGLRPGGGVVRSGRVVGAWGRGRGGGGQPLPLPLVRFAAQARKGRGRAWIGGIAQQPHATVCHRAPTWRWGGAGGRVVGAWGHRSRRGSQPLPLPPPARGGGERGSAELRNNPMQQSAIGPPTWRWGGAGGRVVGAWGHRSRRGSQPLPLPPPARGGGERGSAELRNNPMQQSAIGLRLGGGVVRAAVWLGRGVTGRGGGGGANPSPYPWSASRPKPARGGGERGSAELRNNPMQQSAIGLRPGGGVVRAAVWLGRGVTGRGGGGEPTPPPSPSRKGRGRAWIGGIAQQPHATVCHRAPTWRWGGAGGRVVGAWGHRSRRGGEPTPPPTLGPLRGPSPQGEGESVDRRNCATTPCNSLPRRSLDLFIPRLARPSGLAFHPTQNRR